MERFNHRYEVFMTFKHINRKNSLVVWANDSAEAVKTAMRMWGRKGEPEQYTELFELEAVETKY